MNVKALVLIDEEPVALFAEVADGDEFAKRKAGESPHRSVTLCEELDARQVKCTQFRARKIEWETTVRSTLNAILSKKKKIRQEQGY